MSRAPAWNAGKHNVEVVRPVSGDSTSRSAPPRQLRGREERGGCDRSLQEDQQAMKVSPVFKKYFGASNFELPRENVTQSCRFAGEEEDLLCQSEFSTTNIFFFNERAKVFFEQF